MKRERERETETETRAVKDKTTSLFSSQNKRFLLLSPLRRRDLGTLYLVL